MDSGKSLEKNLKMDSGKSLEKNLKLDLEYLE